MTAIEDYAVGNRKPPAHSQFKPGQSGNPKGRPRGSVGFRQALVAAANERIAIVENGRKVRRSKAEIAALQLVNKAAAGEYRAIDRLSKLLDMTEARAAVGAEPSADKPEPRFGSKDDEKVMEAFMQRLKKETSS